MVFQITSHLYQTMILSVSCCLLSFRNKVLPLFCSFFFFFFFLSCPVSPPPVYPLKNVPEDHRTCRLCCTAGAFLSFSCLLSVPHFVPEYDCCILEMFTSYGHRLCLFSGDFSIVCSANYKLSLVRIGSVKPALWLMSPLVDVAFIYYNDCIGPLCRVCTMKLSFLFFLVIVC